MQRKKVRYVILSGDKKCYSINFYSSTLADLIKETFAYELIPDMTIKEFTGGGRKTTIVKMKRTLFSG